MSFTTKSNFEERTRSLDLSDLPLVFQDTIFLTRKLQIRYLWIDAICIIQDSAEDWRRQSSNMMSIYELCWLNVSACGSEVDQELFLKRNTRLTRRARLPASFSSIRSTPDGSDEPSVYVHLASEFYAKAAYEGFLSKRGWVMQERILSPRTVYFAKEELFWECSTHTASEAAPWGQVDDSVWPMIKLNSPNGLPTMSRYLPDYSTDAFSKNQKYNLDSFLSIHNAVLEEMWGYWNRVIESFSSLDLTNHLDRLPAIEGLARALHKYHIQGGSFDEEYCDGHWIGDMHRSLLWSPADTAASTEYRNLRTQTAPSWSWASYDNGVRLLPDVRENTVWQEFSHSTNPIFQYIQGSNPESESGFETHGLQLYTEPEYSTSLEFHWNSACVRAAKLRLDLHPGFITCLAENTPWLANFSGTPIAQVILDHHLERDKSVTDYLMGSDYAVYCMQTVFLEKQDAEERKNKNKQGIMVSASINGLVLIPSVWASRLVFRRIGVFINPNEVYKAGSRYEEGVRFFGSVILR